MWVSLLSQVNHPGGRYYGVNGVPSKHQPAGSLGGGTTCAGESLAACNQNKRVGPEMRRRREREKALGEKVEKEFRK